MPSFVVLSTLASIHVGFARGIVFVSFAFSATGGAGVCSGDFKSMGPTVVEVGRVPALVGASSYISSYALSDKTLILREEISRFAAVSFTVACVTLLLRLLLVRVWIDQIQWLWEGFQMPLLFLVGDPCRLPSLLGDNQPA